MSKRSSTSVSGEVKYCAETLEHVCRLCLSNEQLVALFTNVRGRNAYFVRKFVKLATELLHFKFNINDALPNFLCKRCERSLLAITKFKQKCDESLSILRKASDIVEPAASSHVSKNQKKIGELGTVRREDQPTKERRECIEILRKLPSAIRVGTLKTRAAREDLEEEWPTEQPACGIIDRHARKADGQVHVKSNADECNADPPISKRNEDETGHGESEERLLETDEESRLEWECVGESDEKVPNKTAKERTVCSVCGAMVNNLTAHMATHSKLRPHQCDQCPKSFTTRHKLQTHISSVHLRRRDFKCDICGKGFLERNHLKGHMRIHSGERKHQCDLCPKTFLFAGTLRCHKLTHSQEKSHECPVCGKLFLMRTTLNKHVRVHSDERPYRCDVCDKQFRTSTHLAVHRRTHTGEKPLVCRICGMAFAQHKTRSVHMKSKHPEELVRLNLIDEKGHLKV
ncbi:zinc finger and SCAN domain-containing protein 21-like [Anopheles darlingi]|uniref:zinc finger and SCAN domain-containing protein 21-like n=1 Tax=Anopheles darlingi TaxID=43151 RepID=UPI002100613C|nr:zinc finger and SCAN domain-containing protein 21-like [Anopheles darlingi]